MHNEHKYENGEITIVWKPSLCIHSTICWRKETGLPDVFNPKLKPWIKPESSESKNIIAQVAKCPSGALSYFKTGQQAVETAAAVIVDPAMNGPLIIRGDIQLNHGNGQTEIKKGVTAFCRCGHSNNKPFCDGSHLKNH